MRDGFQNVEQVFVHTEPSNIELDKGSMVSNQEIDEIVQSIVREKIALGLKV